MKKRLYHLTDSGVRIPHRKIKWVNPLTDKALDPPATLPSDRKGFDSLDLFIYNYNVLADFCQRSTGDDMIDVVDLEEGDCSEE